MFIIRQVTSGWADLGFLIKRFSKERCSKVQKFISASRIYKRSLREIKKMIIRGRSPITSISLVVMFNWLLTLFKEWSPSYRRVYVTLDAKKIVTYMGIFEFSSVLTFNFRKVIKNRNVYATGTVHIWKAHKKYSITGTDCGWVLPKKGRHSSSH